jgi:hypothetical protein
MVKQQNGKHGLVREGEASQHTKTGFEIPVPKTDDFNRLLRKAAVKRPSDASQSDGAKR